MLNLIFFSWWCHVSDIIGQCYNLKNYIDVGSQILFVVFLWGGGGPYLWDVGWGCDAGTPKSLPYQQHKPILLINGSASSGLFGLLSLCEFLGGVSLWDSKTTLPCAINSGTYLYGINVSGRTSPRLWSVCIWAGASRKYLILLGMPCFVTWGLEGFHLSLLSRDTNFPKKHIRNYAQDGLRAVMNVVRLTSWIPMHAKLISFYFLIFNPKCQFL